MGNRDFMWDLGDVCKRLDKIIEMLQIQNDLIADLCGYEKGEC